VISPFLGVRRKSDAGQGVSSGGVTKSRHEKVLQHDNHTCRCCGFRSLQFQRVVPYEGDFVTMCAFCEQCFALDAVGAMGSGVLIWLPEISQINLNHIARAVYVARASDNSKLSELANRAFDGLMARRTDAKRRLGSDDPLLLATVFHESLDDQEYKDREKKLEGIRLMPVDKRLVAARSGTVDMFPRMLQYWISPEGPFGRLPIDKWEEMFSSAVGSISKN